MVDGALFEIEVQDGRLTAGCSCGQSLTIRRGNPDRDLLADWLFDHARCPEVEVWQR